MRRRGWLLAAICAGLSAGAVAQRRAREIAVPFYQPGDAVAALHRHAGMPRAVAFEREALALQDALSAHCGSAGPAAARAREAWQRAVAAWENLSTVAFGPLIERRSQHRIDFMPTRPASIRRAIDAAPADAAALERIGTPAKGLPALEWLLWIGRAQLGTPACGYMVRLAEEIRDEAAALVAAFEAAARRDWSGEEAAAAAFGEFVNQWLGALERLRWAQLERPLREGRTPAIGRIASGAAAASWARQWRVLREFALADADVAPERGSAVVPIETYLRGRGRNDLADRWVRSIEQAGLAMRGLHPSARPAIRAATRRLAATKALFEAEVAPALNVALGFSDADGD